jgi:phage terminase large subunit GpA-like protein
MMHSPSWPTEATVPSALDDLEAKTWHRLAPPPRLTIAEWADAYRVLPPEGSAEPGRWRTSRTPYLRAVMEAITDRRVETVVVMASSQVGKTELLLNTLGYFMHLDPCAAMLLEPTLEIAAAVSKDRLMPMLRVTPALRGLIGPARAHDRSNSLLHKSFPGGHVTLAGANSPASLASRPIRVLLADEVDRWPTSSTEGDPLALAHVRTRTFSRRKIIITSSPTIKGASRVEDWYAISNQQVYETPCPRCGEGFVFAWEHVRWDEGNLASAHIECPMCHQRIEDTERPAMIAAGTWRATAPFAGIAGFHLWEGVSPWRSLRDQVAAFLVARRSLETRQAWTNTALGRTWEAPGESVEPSHLMLRREDYGGQVPAGVKLVTAGIDSQDDRLEALVCGWGFGEECWILERVSLPGDPARDDVWAQLDELLGMDWPHVEGGTLRIQCALIDAGGHRTQAIYSHVIPRQLRRLYASFGRSGGEKGLLVSPPKPVRPANGTGNVLRRIVDSDQAKALLYARLRVATPGAEYIHFPTSVDETFFHELTSERLVTKRNKYGVPTKTWEQTRERNESLDALVLALAALRIVAPTPARFEVLARQLEAHRLGGAA